MIQHYQGTILCAQMAKHMHHPDPKQDTHSPPRQPYLPPKLEKPITADKLLGEVLSADESGEMKHFWRLDATHTCQQCQHPPAQWCDEDTAVAICVRPCGLCTHPISGRPMYLAGFALIKYQTSGAYTAHMYLLTLVYVQ